MNTLFEYILTVTPSHILCAGTGIRIVIGWRRFNRRGVAGMQHYSNFLIAVIIMFIEWVLNWTANGMILYALLKILVARG